MREHFEKLLLGLAGMILALGGFFAFAAPVRAAVSCTCGTSEGIADQDACNAICGGAGLSTPGSFTSPACTCTGSAATEAACVAKSDPAAHRNCWVPGGAAPAQSGGSRILSGSELNPLGTDDIRVIIGKVIRAVLGVVGSLALLMFIYGGGLWLTSGGESEKIKKGMDTVLWATIGLVVIFAAYALVNFVIKGLTG